MGGTLVAGGVVGPAAADCQTRRFRIMHPSMTTNHARLLALLAAVLVAAVLRLVPHPPNFTPIGAMALFSGAYLGRRALAFAAPLAALLVSDAIIGFYPELAFVYLGTVATVAIGWALSRRRRVLRVGAAALASSILFFLLTNFGVWLVMDYYPKTLDGLAACYVAAIPFFQNSVAGDLFYSALLFGGFALLQRAVPALRETHAQPA